MRRLVLVLGALAVAGCSNFRDMFSAHADQAATAGALTLKPERLAQIMAGPKGVRLNHESGDFLTNLWVDYALFAQAVAERKLPADSAAVAEVLWPEIAELRLSRWHDTLAARRGAVSDAAIEKAYNGDTYRLFQHILFTVRPTATPEERKAAQQKAAAALAQLGRGAAFGPLAMKLSQDPGSARDSGYLPPAKKGQWVPQFDSAGWALAPGGMTGIVESPFGYHIIRRPALNEVKGRFADFLRNVAGRELDSLYLDSLMIRNQAELKSKAAETMRDALSDLDVNRTSGKTIASYKGGDFTVADFVHWVRALPRPYISQLAQLPDSQLKQFGRSLVQNVLFLRQADSAKVVLTADEWKQMRGQYDAQVDSLESEMNLGPDVIDSNVPVAERDKVADLKVQQYFDALIAGKTRLRPLPGALSDLLRGRFPVRTWDAGIDRGVLLAQTIKAKTDTTGAGQAGALRPAPGPAPLPGAAAPAAAPAAPPAGKK